MSFSPFAQRFTMPVFQLYFPLSWLFEAFLVSVCFEAHYMQWLIEDKTTLYSG